MTPSSSALLLFGIAFICLFIAVFPFGPYQATLLIAKRLGMLRPLPRDGEASADELRFAICLCAYNEEAVIREKIENMLVLREAAGALDILIYVDAPSDRTAEIVASFEPEVTLVASKERHGKPWGMNRLVSLTDADIVLFTDANVMVDETAIANLRRYFADPEIGCVTSHLSYTNPDDTATSEVGSFYWRLDEWTKGLETETGSAMGADGSLFAIRRELHRPTPDHLIDDLFVSMSILCKGYRLIRGADVDAYESHTTIARDEFKRKIRIACQCMGVHRALWPELRTLSAWNLYKYVGHRLIRWVGGYFLLASAVFFALALWTSFGFWTMLGLVAALAVIMLLGSLAKFRLIEQINNVLLAFAGNTLGVWRAYWGQPVVTWDLAGSARNDLPSDQPSR
ncbi:MAG: glycosyltransferase [Alphaproteobacteria bacterium]|nr:glycosyltransferase [Alphaproteobacteria bacterium]